MTLRLITSGYCPPSQLEKRDHFLRAKKSLRQSWKLNLANAHILSSVPVAQICFYFQCTTKEVERWCLSVHRQKTLNYNKWRHELDLYEIAGVTPEELT